MGPCGDILSMVKSKLLHPAAPTTKKGTTPRGPLTSQQKKCSSGPMVMEFTGLNRVLQPSEAAGLISW